MACCAFAVFLIGQIAFAWERVRTFVFGVRADTERSPNLAVLWQPNLPGQARATAAALPMSTAPSWTIWLRRTLTPQTIVLMVSVELAMGAGGLAFLASQAGYSAADLNAALAMICQGGQIAAL